MPVREQDIGARLAAAAAQVSEPRFAVESVIRRVRRRRARRIAIAGVSMAVVALVAVAGLSGLGAGNHPAGPDVQSPRGVWLPIRISVLGQTALITHPGTRQLAAVPAGRRVAITARVTVPHGVRVRTLWLGITTMEGEAGGPAGPTGWAAILLRTTRPLTSGHPTFRLHWSVPGKLLPGSKVYLIAYWVAGRTAPVAIIASLVIRPA